MNLLFNLNTGELLSPSGGLILHRSGCVEKQAAAYAKRTGAGLLQSFLRAQALCDFTLTNSTLDARSRRVLDLFF